MSDILVADDTRAIRNALSILLEEEGHTVRLASDGAEALAEYRKKRPDLLLLDVMMPKKSGYQVLRQIREADPTLPVMILSAKGSPADVALGLDLGSDDYLPKPFDSEVLISRINAIFRRMNVLSRPDVAPKAENGFAVASYWVDTGRLTLVAPDGSEEALSLREIGMLRILTAHANEVVSRDRLINEVWGIGYSGTSRTLDQHIFRLRRKLGADGGRLETMRSAGYRYIAQ
jgi:DNA-binding response OmpR family regulator